MVEDTAGTWLGLTEAGRRLGLERDALRKRVRRGTCPYPTRRDNRGQWQVRVPDEAKPVRSDVPLAVPDARDELVAELRASIARLESENAYLRVELARRRWPGLRRWLRRMWEGEEG